MESFEGKGNFNYEMAPRPRIYVEVGLGDMRVRGHGDEFPVEPGDLILTMDRLSIQATEVGLSNTEVEPSLDEPLLDDVIIARSRLDELKERTKAELDELVDGGPRDGLSVNDLAKVYELDSMVDGFRIIGANMDDIHRFTEEKKIHYQPIYADGRAMPLADNQVDGVLFSNIFGDDFVQPEAKFALLNEAARVLRPDCAITVVESRTSDTAAEFLNKLLPDEWRVQYYDETSPEWPKLKARYNRLRFSAQPERTTGAAVYFIEPAV